MKIGLLIPTTSNNRDWFHPHESYLHTYTMTSFSKTYNQEHQYIFYVGIDDNDILFDNKDTWNFFDTYCKKNLSNTSIKFISMSNIKKGHLSKMWNRLFQVAFNENCDYFFQCGDDIIFTTTNWINDSIDTLKLHNNIGITGPINNNNYILTQTFVHRTHMNIFGFYFPEDIYNWCIDDWINQVYRNEYFYPLYNHYCGNEGGEPRYLIDNKYRFNNINKDKETNKNILILKHSINNIVLRERKKINNYLSIN
jgi:hypothetical protein|tara:strand:- start:10143 stop:10901 length:759 start_codon:yes stop_codon:yes gene_type:complete